MARSRGNAALLVILLVLIAGGVLGGIYFVKSNADKASRRQKSLDQYKAALDKYNNNQLRSPALPNPSENKNEVSAPSSLTDREFFEKASILNQQNHPEAKLIVLNYKSKFSFDKTPEEKFDPTTGKADNWYLQFASADKGLIFSVLYQEVLASLAGDTEYLVSENFPQKDFDKSLSESSLKSSLKRYNLTIPTVHHAEGDPIDIPNWKIDAKDAYRLALEKYPGPVEKRGRTLDVWLDLFQTSAQSPFFPASPVWRVEFGFENPKGMGYTYFVNARDGEVMSERAVEDLYFK